MSTSKTIFDVGDRVTWLDEDVDPPVQRTGNIAVVLSTQFVILCPDGRERFVTERNKSLKLMPEEAQ